MSMNVDIYRNVDKVFIYLNIETKDYLFLQVSTLCMMTIKTCLLSLTLKLSSFFLRGCNSDECDYITNIVFGVSLITDLKFTLLLILFYLRKSITG